MTSSDTLSSMFIFKGVPKTALQEVCSMAPPVSFQPGVTVFNQGDESDVALLLIDGKLGVEVSSAGQLREVGQVNIGEIVGETALFARSGKRSATVRALQTSQCLLINRELLTNAAKNEAIIAIERHLLATLARRIRRTNQETAKLWKEIGSTPEAAAEPAGFVAKLKKLFGGE
ncbi:MAG: cyclic nucleotide-binding domain-containing protein [Myxococcota bacterium]|nr:cyclic nucleotide-binding domain-containing protein [Myxococcota bacterium]MEC9388946.1 cyclic nucleotide-binding domain-containing protein [Myxococcota bacterium]